VIPSSTKFIERNRPPRVHISYDLKTDGAQRKVELPFVMGVMADLSGDLKPGKELPRLDQRKFDDFSVDNFDARMKAIEPRLEFFVDRTIGEVKPGEDDKLKIEITFEKMDDFSPEVIARKVAPLAELLKAREQLTNLMSWTDGRNTVEDLLSKLVHDPSLLQAVASAPAPAPAAGAPAEPTPEAGPEPTPEAGPEPAPEPESK
jgi:type VI secretion system protein ImpB